MRCTRVTVKRAFNTDSIIFCVMERRTHVMEKPQGRQNGKEAWIMNEKLKALINVLENPQDYSSEEVRDALSKAIDILKAIAGYKEGVVSK